MQKMWEREEKQAVNRATLKVRKRAVASAVGFLLPSAWRIERAFLEADTFFCLSA